MWSLYQLATKTAQRPSHMLNVWDQWAAYQLDCAVVYLGMTIEGLLNEMENVGGEQKPRYEPKYRLADLLREDYRVAPRDPDRVDWQDLKKTQGITIEGL